MYAHTYISTYSCENVCISRILPQKLQIGSQRLNCFITLISTYSRDRKS